MTWKDKVETGLKEDAPFRKDNLPESQVSADEHRARPSDADAKRRATTRRTTEGMPPAPSTKTTPWGADKPAPFGATA